MRYYTIFEDSDCGEFPVGWTRKFSADSSRALYSISVENGSPNVKRRQLRFSGTTGIGFITYDAVDADTSPTVEMLVPFAREATSRATVIQLFVRLTASIDAYRLVLFLNDDTSSPNLVALQRFELGSVTATPILSAFTFDGTKNYLVRFNVQDLPGSPSTTQIQIKIWSDDIPEPAAWTFSVLDASGRVFGMAGSCGVSASAESASVPATALFNYISVGTNGDTAFKPKTNAEWSAWLDDQTVERRLLGEMSYMGYQAAGATGQPPGMVAYAEFDPGSGGSPDSTLVSTVDSLQNSIVGDITMMSDINPFDWANPNGVRLLLSKGDRAGVDFAVFLQVAAGAVAGNVGTLQLAWSPDGASILSATCTEALPAFGSRIKVAAELDVDNGAAGWSARFWLSQDAGRTWGQMGTTVTGAGVTSIHDSAQPWEIGTQQGGLYPYRGLYYRAEVWTGQAISNTTGIARVIDFYPQKMPVALYLAGTYKSLYTGESYTIPGLNSTGIRIVNKVGFSFNYRNVYIADGGFVSQAWDTPATQPYSPWIVKKPQFSRLMSMTLSGQGTTGLGQFSVSNPKTGQMTSAGQRDDWTRIKWKRDYVRFLLGDKTWARADFRTIILGRLGAPTADSAGITFAMSDLSDALNDVLQSTLFTSGDLIGKPKPISAGLVAAIEPPLISGSSGVKEYQIHDGPMDGAASALTPLFNSQLSDNFIPVCYFPTASRGVTAVNAGTDTLTCGPGTHGMSAGGTIFTSGAWPAPLAASMTLYIIAAGLTANDFRVSLTPGGAAVNITGATTGGQWSYMPATLYASKGTFIYATNPAGRITVELVRGARGTEDGNIANVLDWIAFKKFGLPLDFKDAASFAALAAAMPVATYRGGVFFPSSNAILANQALLQASQGFFTWYGFTPDGVLQVGRFGLPSATARMSFIEGDVKLDSLKMTNRVLPIDFVKRQVTYAPKQYASPANSSDPLYALPNFSVGPVTNATVAVPLDNSPGDGDLRQDLDFNTSMSDLAAGVAMQTYLISMFGKMLGVYEFQTRFRALDLNYGDTIQLTHSRFGWKTWTAADPASPDNLVTLDSTKAIVIGVAPDLSIADGFPVKLTVFRPIPGYYPTSNLD